jgi:hypothetical protein
MAAYDLNTLPPHVRAAVWELVQACQPDACLPPHRCPHATEAQACCPGCAVAYEAEAILAAAQPATSPWGAGPFPRGLLEQAVLEILQSVFPLPATTLQVASLLDRVPYRQVRTVLQALALLGTIAHPCKGYYRHRPGR